MLHEWVGSFDSLQTRGKKCWFFWLSQLCESDLGRAKFSLLLLKQEKSPEHLLQKKRWHFAPDLIFVLCMISRCNRHCCVKQLGLRWHKRGKEDWTDAVEVSKTLQTRNSKSAPMRSLVHTLPPQKPAFPSTLQCFVQPGLIDSSDVVCTASHQRVFCSLRAHQEERFPGNQSKFSCC